MRTIETTIYTLPELRDLDHRAYEKALDAMRKMLQGDQFYTDEIYASLKAVLEACGVSIGHRMGFSYHNPHFNIEHYYQQEIADLCGPRAMAWLENNLLADLRIPWSGKVRNMVRKHGAYYRPGMILPCPLTGMCYDHDFIDSLVQDARSGRITLGDSFRGLRDLADRIAESEMEYRLSEEALLEDAECNGFEFTAEGGIA